jgi:hypothetical protein
MLSRMLWSMLATLRVCRCLMWCRRFVCDFLDEVPDDVFCRLTPAAQVAFEPVNPTTGVKTRLRAQYYVMAMHSMSLANALALFKVCAWQQSLPAVALLQVLLVFLVLLLVRVMHVPVCCLYYTRWGSPAPCPSLSRCCMTWAVACCPFVPTVCCTWTSRQPMWCWTGPDPTAGTPCPTWSSVRSNGGKECLWMGAGFLA